MLRVAQRRCRSAGHSIAIMAADGLRLPFGDAKFDRVTIGYGLRNLPDFEAGLREFHRVTRPGGRLLVLDFAKPRQRLWRACYFAYLRLVLPVLGWSLCGDAAAYAYILESLRDYPDQEAVAELLGRSGWTALRVNNLLGGTMSLHCAAKPG